MRFTSVIFIGLSLFYSFNVQANDLCNSADLAILDTADCHVQFSVVLFADDHIGVSSETLDQMNLAEYNPVWDYLKADPVFEGSFRIPFGPSIVPSPEGPNFNLIKAAPFSLDLQCAGMAKDNEEFSTHAKSVIELDRKGSLGNIELNLINGYMCDQFYSLLRAGWSLDLQIDFKIKSAEVLGASQSNF